MSMENKRRREEEESSDASSSSPEAKRFRADVLLEIFDDDDEEDHAGGLGEPLAASDDLATVMKSLEREIALAAPSSPPPELGYLLEASDDELGIPPAVEEHGGGAQAEDAASATAAALWFGDVEMPGNSIDGGFGFGFLRFEEDGGVMAGAAEEGLVVDGGPFDYARDDIWAV